MRLLDFATPINGSSAKAWPAASHTTNGTTASNGNMTKTDIAPYRIRAVLIVAMGWAPIILYRVVIVGGAHGDHRFLFCFSIEIMDPPCWTSPVSRRTTPKSFNGRTSATAWSVT
jgi:hypothetical protein